MRVRASSAQRAMSRNAPLLGSGTLAAPVMVLLATQSPVPFVSLGWAHGLRVQTPGLFMFMKKLKYRGLVGSVTVSFGIPGKSALVPKNSTVSVVPVPGWRLPLGSKVDDPSTL